MNFNLNSENNTHPPLQYVDNEVCVCAAAVAAVLTHCEWQHEGLCWS